MLYSLQNPLPVFQKSYQNLHQCCCRIPMNGSGVVIEVYSADIGTHSLYSKIVSKLALVLLLNTYERFRGSNRSLLCKLRNLYNYILSFVSKLALVLLQNPTPLEYRSREINSRDTNERFQGRNRNVLCSFWNPSLVFENHIISNVTECIHPVPISIQSIFYNLRNKTLCPFHIRNLNSVHKKRSLISSSQILFQRICFK